jgi:hypothetical protein
MVERCFHLFLNLKLFLLLLCSSVKMYVQFHHSSCNVMAKKTNDQMWKNEKIMMHRPILHQWLEDSYLFYLWIFLSLRYCIFVFLYLYLSLSNCLPVSIILSLYLSLSLPLSLSLYHTHTKQSISHSKLNVRRRKENVNKRE